MLPSSPLAPFTPAILAQLPVPEPEPRSDAPVEPDLNPMAPMAPVSVPTEGQWNMGAINPNGGNLCIAGTNVQNFPPPPPGRNVLSLQAVNETATMEVCRSGVDGDGQIIGQFMWIDTNLTWTGSNDAAVIRVLTDGSTPNNRGTRMEFLTRMDGLTGPGQVMTISNATGQNQFVIIGLPASPAGLPSGCLWNNAGVLNIVP